MVEQARDSAHSLLKKSSLEAQQRRADAYDEESRWDRYVPSNIIESD